MLKAKVHVSLKEGVLDPQGATVTSALHSLGFGEVEGVRMGKYMELTLDTHSRDEATQRVTEMCDKLLANPVIESYEFTLEDANVPRSPA